MSLTGTSAEAAVSLTVEEMKQRIQYTVSPYVERPGSFIDCYKYSLSSLSVPTSSVFLRPFAQSSTNTSPSSCPSSTLENLPNEILLNIFGLLDIASLLEMAASNSSIRRIVISMPDVRIVKSHASTYLAVSRMLWAGTARYFSFGKFVDTVATSICAICRKGHLFAPWVCLLLCHRVCVSCISDDQQTIRMPKAMAIKCLGLDEDDLLWFGGAAATIDRVSFDSQGRQQSGLGYSTTTRPVNNTEAVPLRLALTVSCIKYAAEGGLDYVKLLIESYMQEQHPQLHASGTMTAITDTCDVRGLHDAIKDEWGHKTPDASWVLMAYLPYLHSSTPPLRFELGVRCQGCIRDHGHGRWFFARAAARHHEEKAYLMSQYRDHFQHCSTARSIFRGELLNMDDERKLKISMLSAMSPFGIESGPAQREAMRIVNGVNFDASPSEVRASIGIAIEQIQVVVNRHLQLVASLSGPMESCDTRPTGD